MRDRETERKRQQIRACVYGTAAFSLRMCEIEIPAGLLLNGIPAGPDQSETVSPVEAASAAVSAAVAAVSAA